MMTNPNTTPHTAPSRVSAARLAGTSARSTQAATPRRAAAPSPRRSQGPQPYREPEPARRRAAGAPAGRYSAATRAQEAERRSQAAARRRSRSQTDLMRYAEDNGLVRWFYDLTTGPWRVAFYGAIALLVVVGLYFPVKDWYGAIRTENILEQQAAIRERYNDSIGKEVEGYLSEEGVQDAARKDLGMAMPGEKTINVEGLDEDGNPVVVHEGKDAGKGTSADKTAGEAGADGEDAPSASASHGAASAKDGSKLKGPDARDKNKTGAVTAENVDPDGELTSSAEVEAAEKSVYENSEWYWKFFDFVFGFDGKNTIAVVSTGE